MLLGNISVRTFQVWKQGQYGRVGMNLAGRMSNLIGNCELLRLLIKEEKRDYGWIAGHNRSFRDQNALDVMRVGHLTDLTRVHRYLDA